MKTSIVPAQVTTVEDKIIGSLTLQQLLLLAMPFFLGFVAFIVFPPTLQFVLYKFLLIAILFVIFGTFAVRIKGKLLITWAIVFFSYNTRSRYYIYDKKDNYLRESEQALLVEDTQEVEAPKETMHLELPRLSIADKVRLEEIMNNPAAKLRFEAGRKGELNVHITEVK